MMTLEEAIMHCQEKSCGNSECALEHKQLAEWLKELKELRNKNYPKLTFLDTLEVKEVDLEKEIQRQYEVHKNPDNNIVKNCVVMTKDGFEYFAKHFFELGMSVNNKA